MRDYRSPRETEHEREFRREMLDDRDQLERKVQDLEDKNARLHERVEPPFVTRKVYEHLRHHADALAEVADRVWLVILKQAGGDCPICGACFDCDCKEGCPGDALVTELTAYHEWKENQG